MPKSRTPLPILVERGREKQNGFGWYEFKVIAAMQPKRMSVESLRIMYNRNKNTVKAWLRRWDEGERD